MKEIKKKIRFIYENLWTESPWIRSAGIMGAVLLGLTFLNAQMPESVAIDFKNQQLAKIVPIATVVLYFFLAAIFSGDRLRFEKKLRKLEQNFRYDKRGTLFNGNEPNIAFRIITFKGILSGLSERFNEEELAESLIEVGVSASSDFAKNFPEIYNSEIAKVRINKSWKEIPIAEKLVQWSEYDSSTGWGILTSKIIDHEVTVRITHLQGLFSGKGGHLFGSFLAGYCKTVISEIANSQDGGKYGDCSRAIFLKKDQSDENTLQLKYKLK